MTYRDDSDARVARTDALQRELDNARDKLAKRDAELEEAQESQEALTSERDDLRKEVKRFKRKYEPNARAQNTTRIAILGVAIATLAAGGAAAFVLVRQAPQAEVGEAAKAAPEPVTAHSDATVVVESNPAGANVYLGDELIGTTPLRLEVSPGTLELRIEHPGYRTLTKIVSATAERTSVLSVELAADE